MAFLRPAKLNDRDPMEFERYEEVPPHLAAKLVEATGAGAAVSP
ncbi:MAG TPA: hypothetical protein VFP21_00585 [Solirubrobacterales bacterium]|nr:hypothetical protein [Solirubrobacterales bacterium]